MPTIYIDGRPVDAKDGQTIIEAASKAGIDVPHFCWHPGLSVAGNCRMCLVEVGMPKRTREGQIETDEHGNAVIGFMPKMQIACATPVADGMHVRLAHEKVERAQESVMEFILINHPLDCPICDEAGQCKLQEYGLKHSRGESRFDETKNHKDKRRPLGPNVMFDAERCISCSRCIRFANEVAEQPVLSFVQRGDHVTIETFPGTQFDSEYSMNVIEICPVGALTSRDFRFKARVWDMSFNDSICTGCSKGCNIKVGVRDNNILRLEPRVNMHVNEYWMCDTGRLTQYEFVNNERIDKPLLRRGGSTVEAEWEEAVAEAAQAARRYSASEIAVVASSLATNEDNAALLKFAKEVLGGAPVSYVSHLDPTFADDFLHTGDKSPNTAGVKALGLSQVLDPKALASAITAGKIKAVWCLYEDLAALSPELASALASVPLLVVHASNHNDTTRRAHVVLSTPTYAELEGTYTNVDSRVQYVAPALVTRENERRMGMKMSRLDKFGAHNDRWTQGPRRACRQAWRVLQSVAQAAGAAEWGWTRSEEVFLGLASSNEGFAGMSYGLLRQRRGVVLSQAGVQEEELFEYDSHALKPN